MIFRRSRSVAGAVGFRLAEEVEGWSEAIAWVCRNGVNEASRRSVAEGLDHSGTLEAEKRYAWWGGWHRSVSGVSFRREVLTRMSQDKPHGRATKREYGMAMLLMLRCQPQKQESGSLFCS